MKTHPYLRAYMAGITVPTAFLLVILGVLVLARSLSEMALPIERFVVFPMAVVPNAWGLWNVLYVALAGRRRLPLGLHGGLLAMLLPFLAYGVTRAIGLELPSHAGTLVLVGVPVAVAVYYLVWKHLVGYLNDLLGIQG